MASANVAAGGFNNVTRAVKLMTATMNKSISVFKSFNNQMNDSNSVARAFMDTRQQLLSINAALSKTNSAIDNTAGALENLEDNIESLSKMIQSISAKPNQSRSSSNSPFFGTQILKVEPAVYESFSKFTSQENQISNVEQPAKAAVAAPTAMTLNNGKSSIDALKQQFTDLKKEPVKTIIDLSLRNAVEEQQIKGMLINQTGSKNEGGALFNALSTQALEAGMALSEAAKGAIILKGATSNAKQISELSALSIQLATLDPAERGNEAASRAVMTAAQGDSSSLAKQYNISPDLVQSANLEALGKSGDMNGFISALDTVLEKADMGKESMKQMMDTPVKQAQMLEQNIASSFAGAGTGAVTAFMEPLQLLNDFFGSDVFQPFFDSLGNVLTWVAGLLAWIASAATWLGLVISVGWPVIEPIIWGIVAGITAWHAIIGLLAARTAIIAAYMSLMVALSTSGTVAFALLTLVTSGLSAAWATLNATMKRNVIIFIISLIVALIVFIIALWQKNDAFAAGFLRAWNSIFNFLDRLPAYFWQLAEWMYSPLFWWAKKIGFIYDAVINGIIEGINKVLGIINKVTGKSYEITARFNMDNIIDDTLDFMKAKKEDAYARASKNAAEREQSVNDFIKNRTKEDTQEEFEPTPKFDPNAIAKEWGNSPDLNEIMNGSNNSMSSGSRMTSPAQTGFQSVAPDINRVNEVGSINETVDISSEDLKTMRELAEMKNIQNFVSLQPTVSVQTGDINNGYDIDTIIGRIERSLNEEIAMSAERTYNV
ncbi:hypothetical protein [Paenibacillus paridis]|uniref:hypothetical protein n=1 Tax=Paenibacillus paridis TaxID=2583376 RepID=UPI0011222D94|nr:hypothetical protein [Paenibacillus paridis]